MKQLIKKYFFGEAIPISLILIIIVTVYGRLLFEKQGIALGEALSFWSYGLAAIQRSLFTFHQFPMWDNTIGSGYTLLGHPKVLQFYPLIYPFLLIHHPIILTRYFIIAQLLCGCFFLYIFLRYLKVNRIATLFGVLAYTCNLYILSNIINGFFAELNTLTWLPFIFFFLVLALQKKNLWFVFPACLGFSMLVFGGALFGVHYVLIGVAVFLLGYALQTHEAKPVLQVAILFYSFSFLFSAIKLFPILEYTNVSIRSTIPLSVAENNVTPGYIAYILKTLVTASFFTSGDHANVIGQLLLNVPFFLLAVLSVFSRRRVIVYPMMLVTVIAVIGAFGKAFPVDIYAFFYHVVPGFKSQQYTARFLLLTFFTLPFLAAIGLDLILRIRVRKFTYILPFTVGSLVIIGAFIVISKQKYLIDTFNFPLSLSLENPHFLETHKKELTEYRVYNNVLLGPDQDMMTNYAALGKGYQTTAPLYIGMIPEYYVIEPLWYNGGSRTHALAVDKTNKLLAVLNVKYLLVKPGSSVDNNTLRTIENYTDIRGKKVSEMDQLIATRNRWEFFPSGTLLLGQDSSDFANAHKARKIVFGRQLDILHSSIFTSEDNAVTDYNLQTLKAFSQLVLFGSAFHDSKKTTQIIKDYKKQGGSVIRWGEKETGTKITGDSTSKSFTAKVHNAHEEPGLLKLTFALHKPGLFTYSNLYYPGWEAYLDGRKTKVFMADSLVKGVVIPTGGEHTLVLRYQPFSFLLGALLSGGSIAALLLAFLFKRKSVRLVHKAFR